MSEHLQKHEQRGERQASHGEIEKAAAERLKQLENQSEQPEKGRKHEVEQAREKIQHIEEQRPASESAPSDPALGRSIISLSANYNNTMASLRHRMKPAERTFSKIIHQPAVEAVSEVVGKTVLRPSVSLGATTCAVIITGTLYILARANGFVLRGSEVLISLVVGAIIGLLIEGIYKSLRKISRR